MAQVAVIGWRRGALALTLLAHLSACNSYLTPGAPPLPRLAPALAPADTPASAAERGYYAATQTTLLASGLLRTDGGDRDSAFDARRLTETFLKIAFYDEYGPSENGLVQQEAAARLGRWQKPVRVSVEFGASVPPDRQASDRARIDSYLARLSALTLHPITAAAGRPNFVVFIGSVEERAALGPRLSEMLPGLSPALLAGATAMGRSNFCLVYVNSDPGGTVRTRAMAVIPSELPDLMGLMCLHEELAQGLGLGNDSRAARPSIFNDDNEFATLTAMDELMLRMLYAPELTPGMTEAEARPIVQALANRLMGGAS